MSHRYEIHESPLSRVIEIGDEQVRIEIYKSEDEPGWILEVIDAAGHSAVWDETFESDFDAINAVIDVLEREGVQKTVLNRSDAPFGSC